MAATSPTSAQQLLDASMDVQLARRAWLARGDARRQQVRGTPAELDAYVHAACVASAECLSATQLSAIGAHAWERRRALTRLGARNGTRMSTVMDVTRAPVVAASLGADEDDLSVRVGHVPMQLKLLDRTTVVVHGSSGPDEDPAVALVDDPRTAAAALVYFRALWRVAAPVRAVQSVADREERVLRLLGTGLTDDEIARVLGVSVRTVRADVRRVQDRLGVRGRYQLGYRLGLRASQETETVAPLRDRGPAGDTPSAGARTL
ncbi:helix-turn-helix transcriptional regulator [Phycicoccus flavus]|uniref:Helix-turn-helix transcriptional regulator n=1 Tax=Phycicoccus flavus TaxID=2502783 RepID=A0A8T6R377_9MICO|nr:helix-turn-helix transcriptional regulator [Phycicoccus flavus]NHA66651.1 helix-turn-helix transcriptional regulator [Phycicoccus flavus]